MRPPLKAPDASRPSQFATQSVTCAILREELYVMPVFSPLLFHKKFKRIVLNFDRKVMNFLLRLRGTWEKVSFGTTYTGYSCFKAGLCFQ